MINLLFSVFDSKAAAYLPPFHSQNKATALRQFESAIMSDGHDFNAHAHDYTLWTVGSFDNEKATLKPATPELIANAHEIKAQLDLP